MSGDPFQQSGPSPWEAPSTAPGQEGPPPGDGPGIPWENEQSFSALLETIKGVLLDPSRTFAGARRDAGIGPAVIYAVMLGFVGGVVSTGWSFLTSSIMGSTATPFPDELKWLSALSEPGLSQLIAVPFGVLIGLFVGGGIVHLLLMMVGGANAGFEATVRCIAFASGSVALLQLIPLVGASIGGIWAMVIEIMAIKELHGTTTGKAATAVLAPLLVCCCLVAIMAAAGGAYFAQTLGNQ